MSIIEQITKNLVNSEKHAPILKALIEILEEKGEKGVKERIKKWIEEIETEMPPSTEDEA